MGLVAPILAVALSVATACGGTGEGGAPDGTWVGTITTEGNVTTVVNESGSVWGGKARLVEEASIGVEAGADEYMLGSVRSLAATDDRIAVLDYQVHLVRIYDHAGNFLVNAGGSGGGPGEFVYPGLLAMDEADRVYVLDPDANRISQFAPDGSFISSWAVSRPRCCIGKLFAAPNGDRLWVQLEERNRETSSSRYGVQAFGPDGPIGDTQWVPDIDFEQPTYRVDRFETATPFAPHLVWNVTPSGGVVAGANDRYRFEVLAPDGSTTVVERYWEPVPIEPDEWEWWRRLTVAVTRLRYPDWSWDGTEMPHHRPAYSSLVPAVSGEAWVPRDIGSRRVGDCLENPLTDFTSPAAMDPCFLSEIAIDAFDRDGRYLGEIDRPSGLAMSTVHVDGDLVVGVVTDEAGVVRVKRYRLVPPGEEGP